MDALFEQHDRDLNKAHNMKKCENESGEDFEKRKQEAKERADRDLAEGLRRLPPYYYMGPLGLWTIPAALLFTWGPHAHGY